MLGSFCNRAGASGGSLVKAGTGTLILSGDNTYTGATILDGGLLSVDGSIANSAVTVDDGATLGGAGRVGGTTVNDGGTLAPGSSVGTLSVAGDLQFERRARPMRSRARRSRARLRRRT